MATEHTPLLGQEAGRRSSSDQTTTTDEPSLGAHEYPARSRVIDKRALAYLLLQHSSSMFGASLYAFASYIFLVEIFTDTLAPACLVGIITKIVGLTCSGYIGGLIDRTHRVRFVRRTIAVHKTLEMINYGLFMVLLGPLSSTASAAFRFKASTRDNLLTWSILVSTIVFSSIISLCQTGMQVAVERDWILAIAQKDPAVLSKLNSYMRIISMLTRIFPSMVVSAVTFALGYIRGGSVFILLAASSMVVEFWWILIVYRQFPVLQVDDERRRGRRKSTREDEQPLLAHTEVIHAGRWERTCDFLQQEASAWGEFIRLPIFWASLASTVRWLDTLKMDGIGVSYFKLAKGWEDGYISLFRGGCLLTSLVGTASEPFLERRWGTRKMGIVSLCFAAATLSPAVAMFFLSPGHHGSLPVWTTGVMVTGIVITRAGSTCFQLAEIKQLQLSLADHPRRNKLTALQSALEDLFQLLRFIMTLGWSTAETFKWTTAVTLASHVTAILLYTWYITGPGHASAA